MYQRTTDRTSFMKIWVCQQSLGTNGERLGYPVKPNDPNVSRSYQKRVYFSLEQSLLPVEVAVW